MAKSAQTLFRPTDKQGQLLMSTGVAGTGDNFRTFTDSAGNLHVDVGSRSSHVHIADIRALAAGEENVNIFYMTKDNNIPAFWKVDTTDTTTADDGGSCLVTAGGKRVKKVFLTDIDIRDFGGVGDASVTGSTGTDNSPAFQAALNYANKLMGVVNVNGRSCVNQPRIIFQHGLYKFSSPVTTTNRALSIIGNGSFFLPDSVNYDMTKPFISGSGASTLWNVYFENITFSYFDHAIDLNNNNIAGGQIGLNRITFQGGIENVKINCRSSRTLFESCNFAEVKTGINIIEGDAVIIQNCIVSLTDFIAGDYFIKNSSVTDGPHIYLNNLWGTPGLVATADAAGCAWIKTNGTISVRGRDCRFGGESNGMVVLDSDAPATHTSFATMIEFEDSDILGYSEATGTTHVSPILLRDVPNNIKIIGCQVAAANIPVDFHPDVDPDTVIAAIPSTISPFLTNIGVTVIGNSAFDKDGQETKVNVGDNIPLQLEPYRTENRRNHPLAFTGTVIDFRWWLNVFQSIAADTTYTTSNVIEGRPIYVLITNTDANAHVVTITDVLFGDGTSTFTVPASSSVQIKLVSIDSIVVGWANVPGGASTLDEVLTAGNTSTQAATVGDLTADTVTSDGLGTFPTLLVNRGVTPVIEMKDTANSSIFIQDANGRLDFNNTNGTTSFTGGTTKVGIGITAPSEALEVNGSIVANNATLTDVVSAAALATDAAGKIIAGDLSKSGSITAVSASYTVLDTDEVVLITLDAADAIITYPDTATARKKYLFSWYNPNGKQLQFQNSGGTTNVVTSVNGAYEILGDGTKWWELRKW